MRLDPRLREELRGQGSLLAAAAAAAVGAAAASIAQAWFLARIIGGAFLDGLGLDDMSPWMMALGGVTLVRSAGIWCIRAAGSRLARRIKVSLRRRLITHLGRLGPVALGGERAGELARTAENGIQDLDAYFSRYLPQLLLAALIPLLVLVVVFPLDPLSGIVLALTAPLIPLFLTLIGHKAERASRRQWSALTRLSAQYLDLLQGLETLKLFRRSRQQGRRIAVVGDQYRRATLQVLRVAFLSSWRWN